MGKPPKQASDPMLTITRWAKILGFDPKTIAQRMRDVGHEISKNSLYGARAVITSVYGDEQQERLRGIQLDNAEKERDQKRDDGELIDRALAEKQISELFTLPISQALTSMPATLAALVNPGDPDLARGVLDRWVEETKKQIRDRLPGKEK